jgi:hypothetical protein
VNLRRAQQIAIGSGDSDSASAYLADRQLSTTKEAIYHRQRRLLSDAEMDKVSASNKASRNKAKLKKSAWKFNSSNFSRYSKALKFRVRHHLSRGRDASDIAIREMVLVSEVQRVIEEINRGAK